MIKGAASQKVSNQTPVRRVGLSRLKANNSLTVISTPASPAKMGNVGKKIGLRSPMKDMLNTDGNEKSPNKSESEYCHKNTPKKTSSGTKSLGSGRKIGLKRPEKEQLEGRDEVKRQIELGSKTPVKKGGMNKEEIKTVSKYGRHSPFKTPTKTGTPRKAGLSNPFSPFKTPTKTETPRTPGKSVGVSNPHKTPNTVIDEKPDYSSTSEVVIEESSPEIEECDEIVPNSDEKVPEMSNTGPYYTANENLSEEKENQDIILVSPKPGESSDVATPNTLPVSLMKRKKKHRLSLTITPDRLVYLRKRKLELAQNEENNTPKRRKIPSSQKTVTFSETIDLTQDSDEETPVPSTSTFVLVEQELPKHVVVKSTSASEHEKFVANLQSQLDKNKMKLKILKALHESNIQTLEFIQQWTEAGIRALEELSETHTPPLEIGFILNQLHIPHEIYGYDATFETFDPKY